MTDPVLTAIQKVQADRQAVDAAQQLLDVDVDALAALYTPPPLPLRFGIACGGAIQAESAAMLGEDLDLIVAMGAQIIRVDANWSQIQKDGTGSYAWGPLDALVDAATQRGLDVHLGILYTPRWHKPRTTTPPDPAVYAGFCAAVASRYAPKGVRSFEIWNEPNVPSFFNPVDVTVYAELLKAANVAIKQVDPTLIVVTGGTAPAPTNATSQSPVDFVTGLYAAGARGYFDAIGHHPYCSPANPGDAQAWSAWYQMIGAAKSIRSIMFANGDGGKQLWATEWGAPTNGPSNDVAVVSEAKQAAMLQQAYELWASYPWAGPLFVYQHRDLGISPATRENFYGLAHNDFTLKPAADALKQLALDYAQGPTPATARRTHGDTSARKRRARTRTARSS